MKVICINNKPLDIHNQFNHSLARLVEGKIYTVIAELEDVDGLLLQEVRSSHPLGGYRAERFRKVDFGDSENN